jgi:hypothetical protein
MTAFQAAVDFIKNGTEKRYSRHGLYHAVKQATGKTLGGSRQQLERIAQAVGGSYVINRRRGYIYL